MALVMILRVALIGRSVGTEESDEGQQQLPEVPTGWSRGSARAAVPVLGPREVASQPRSARLAGRER